MYRGIITGLGMRGLYWLDMVKKHARCEIVAAVEPHEASRKRAIEQFGVSPSMIHDSLADAVTAVGVGGKEGADFVLDVTPPSVHQAVAEAAFGYGLHVLGEKPLSDDYGVCLQVIEAGKKAGVKHMVAQNYRFSPGARQIAKTVASGKVGQPGQCDVRFYMPWADAPGSHYVTQPYMLINDMMVHHFDLMRMILQRNPIAVQAMTWNPSWGWHVGQGSHSIVFEFPDNLYATHVALACSVGDYRDYNGDWRIEGPEGSLEWSDGHIWYGHRHRTETPTREEVLIGAGHPAVDDGLMDEFFDAIEQDREPETSAADNLHSVAMVFAAIKSAKEKRRVELSELG